MFLDKGIADMVLWRKTSSVTIFTALKGAVDCTEESIVWNKLRSQHKKIFHYIISDATDCAARIIPTTLCRGVGVFRTHINRVALWPGTFRRTLYWLSYSAAAALNRHKIWRTVLSHLDALINGLLDDPHGQVTRNLPDVHLFRERGSPGEVVDADQLDQGLGRAVDHRVRDDPGLTKSCSES